jgi:hypothetical protein
VKKYFAIFGLGLSLVATAQAEKIPVLLNCNTGDNDFVGKQLCTELRDDIARSPRYQFKTTDKGFHFTLYLASLPVDNTQRNSAQSVVITGDTGNDVDLYLIHYILLTGLDHVSAQARSIMASLDAEEGRILSSN